MTTFFDKLNFFFFFIAKFLIDNKIVTYKRIIYVKYVYVFLILFLLGGYKYYNMYSTQISDARIANDNSRKEYMLISKDLKFVQTYVKNIDIAESKNILNKYYYTNIDVIYSRFINLLNSQINLLGFTYNLGILDVSKKGGELQDIFKNFLVNKKYDTGLKYVPLDLEINFKVQNRQTFISDSILSISQISNLLYSFVFTLNHIKYDKTSGTFRITFNLFGE